MQEEFRVMKESYETKIEALEIQMKKMSRENAKAAPTPLEERQTEKRTSKNKKIKSWKRKEKKYTFFLIFELSIAFASPPRKRCWEAKIVHYINMLYLILFSLNIMVLKICGVIVLSYTLDFHYEY